MGEIWQAILKFLQDSPVLALTGLVATVTSLGLIVVNTVRGKLGEWLQSWLGAVLEPLDKAFKTQMARRYSLRAYCRLLLANDQFRYLFVPGADDNDSKLDVDRAFVTLRLENASATGPQWFDHKNLLELGKRVRVVGDPGSGKSSLVKRMLRDACQSALYAPKTAKLPVLLELRRLKLPAGVDDAAVLGQWLLGEVKQQVAQYITIHKPAECFDAYFAGPGLLVLLDGLDEVASDVYPHMRDALLDLSQKLALNPKNQVVLTMRSQFHQQVKNDFRDDGSHAVTVQPFTPGDIYQFLQRWPFRGKDEQAAREIRIRIYRELTERVSLREMCRNPLVLAMYVTKDYGRAAGVPPNSRTRFYKQVIDELLIRRSFRQGAKVSASTADSLRDQREEILGTLALLHLLDLAQGANHLSWRAAIDLIQQKMQCDETQAVGHFTELAKDTGLIVEVQKRESFRFIHLTFCEYFAALGACEWVQDGWLNLLAKHAALQGSTTDSGKNRLVEVLPFAFGLMKPMERAERLRTLLPSADTRLVAHTLLECKLYDHAAWPGFIDGWKTTLMATPQTAWNEEWLANLHLFSVVVTDAKQHQPLKGGIQGVPDLAAFFSGMVKQHHAGLNTLLHAYAKLDAEALFSLAELNHIDLLNDFPDVVLANCDQPMFLDAILHKALADPERSTAWAALFAEAGLRATAVADSLAQLPMEAKWQALADATPKANRWHQNRFMPNCLYTQCMSIACGVGAGIDSRLQLLKIFRTIPAPGGYRLLTSGAWLPALLTYASLVIGLALWGWWLEHVLPELVSVFCIVIGYFCRGSYLLKQYQTIFLFQSPCCMFGTIRNRQSELAFRPHIEKLLAKPRLLHWGDMKKEEIGIATMMISSCIIIVILEILIISFNIQNRSGLLLLATGVLLINGVILGPWLGLWLELEQRLIQWKWLWQWMEQGQIQLQRLGLPGFIPAPAYWGKKLATSIAALQQARQALGIRRS